MELHNLKPAKGAVKSKKRIGRGQGSGKGGTSTRGHKGAKSRSGFKNKRNFEGGQMPLQMRLPKRGFKNINRVAYKALNVGRIQEIHDKYKLKDFTLESLTEIGIIDKGDRVKLLGHGELTASVNVSVHATSATAKQIIESKGGSVNLV